MRVTPRTQAIHLCWAVGMRLLSRFGVHCHPLDEALRDDFTRHRPSFDELQSMLYEDRHLSYIGQDRTRIVGERDPRPAKDPGVDPDRIGRYRELLGDLGLTAVSLMPNGTITCRASTCGKSSKGYVYAPSDPVLVAHLDAHPRRPEMHAHVRLDGSWYLYYGWQPY